MSSRWSRLSTLGIGLGIAAACSNGVPLGPSTPTSTSSSAAPAAPTTPPPPTTSTSTAVAYNPDLQPVFTRDCVPCHGNRSPAARYSMTSYTGVMAAVRPGSASSALVIVTQPGGVMYSFLSGDRAGTATQIRTWVLNGAPQTR